MIWYKLHFRNMLTLFLAHRHKAARPCRSIFNNAASIRYPASMGVTNSHSNTRIRNWSNIISLNIIVLSHGEAAAITHFLNINVVIVGGRESIINPEEGTNLHLVIRGKKLSHAIRGDFDNLARTNETNSLIFKINIAVTLKSSHIAIIVLSNNNRSTSVEIASYNNTILGKKKH